MRAAAKLQPAENHHHPVRTGRLGRTRQSGESRSARVDSVAAGGSGAHGESPAFDDAPSPDGPRRFVPGDCHAEFAFVQSGGPRRLRAGVYHGISLWVPALAGSVAFIQLRATLRREDQPAVMCIPLTEPIEAVALPASRNQA
jgi:hypothetical protein